MTFKQKYIILFILGGLTALAPFSIDMYLPAFPSIAKSLNTEISKVTLSLTSYFIGISFGQLIYGPITDKFGRKKPLIFGLALFLIAAIGCALSTSINQLIFMRVILALGGCVGMVVSRAIVRDLFPASEIAKIFSTLMLIVGVAPIIAPTIGSWVVVNYSWNMIFYILSANALALLMAVYFFLPESKKPDLSKSLKVKNVLKDYRKVLNDKTFLFYAFIGSVASGGLFSYISGASFVFIEYFGMKEADFGIIFGFNAFGYILGTQFNRLLLVKFSSFQIIKSATFVLFAVSLLLISLLFLNQFSVYILVGLLFSFLFILGILSPNSTAMALTPFSENAGSASALIGFTQMFCGAIWSVLVSTLHDETLFPMIFGLSSAGIIVFIIVLKLDDTMKKGKLAPHQIKIEN